VTERRGITIYFIDGSKMKLDFPKQTLNEVGTALKLKEVLAARQLIAEVDGVLLVIPFDNIKYIEAHPAPAKLPEYIIKGASIAN
jgi:2-C-methyl-D-erythritol 4-phosphate cytidylyltransferase